MVPFKWLELSRRRFLIRTVLLFWGVLAGMLGAFGLCGCSPGETDLTHPGSTRDLSNQPDTLTGPWSEDRIFRPKLQTGNFVSLLLARQEGLSSDLYFRFDLAEFSDTSTVVGAELDLTLLDGTEAGVRLEAFLIEETAAEWVEGEIPHAGLSTAAEPFFIGTAPIAPNSSGDPVTVNGAVVIPNDVIHAWQVDADANHGFAVRIASSNVGFLNVAASEAIVDTSEATVSTTGLRLRVSEGQAPATLKATDDAYRVFDTRPIDEPTDRTLFVERQIPHRALIRVDLDMIGLPVGSTIHRAELTLGLVPGSIAEEDTFVVAAYRNNSDWTIDVEPDTVTVDPVPTDFTTVNFATESVSFDFGGAMQDWVDGEPNYGLTLRILSEGSDDASLRFASVEADSTAPAYRLEFVSPPSPRWEDARP